MKQSEVKQSPMMLQWQQCKKQAGDALLLFRLGDFYEAFYEDAKTLADELKLTLTKRQNIPMSGIPVHTLDVQLDKLTSKGFVVAIAEQVEDPKLVKGIVKRKIVRKVSPATHFDKISMQEHSNSFFACIERVNNTYGFVILDLSTAELKTFETSEYSTLENEINKLQPKELLISKKFAKSHPEAIKRLSEKLQIKVTTQEDWHFDYPTCYSWLIDHFGVHNLDGFGIKHFTAGINAAGCLLAYVSENLQQYVEHINKICLMPLNSFMEIDYTTVRHLEILSSLHTKSGPCLLKLLDRTHTPMGARLLRSWIVHPLLDLLQIERRQTFVEELSIHESILKKLQTHLSIIRDLQRLNMKVQSGYAGPRDLLSLGISLKQLPFIKELLSKISNHHFVKVVDRIPELSKLANTLTQALVEAPPLKLSDGDIFKSGYNKELDELRDIKLHSNKWLADYQVKLRESLNLKSLKVGYNRAFGYFIEVSRLQAKHMPTSFHKRQTLVNTERFISDELKEFEDKILHAQERISSLEYKLFQNLREFVANYTQDLQNLSDIIAEIDIYSGFAQIAIEHSYTKPVMDKSRVIDIRLGKHPVIDAFTHEESFIPNDAYLDHDECRMLLITGPNMAGKSTYIRQVALIVIMAQIGSFVPASSARVGLVDKVFTRIGASDDLSRGQSTFMVEMAETANILNNVTDHSLVILDEIGRGTSTYDGLSIAWSVAEFLLNSPMHQAKTLFATHYHEMTSMEKDHKGLKNFTVSVDESNNQVRFLRKIIPGAADKSYGIHVARLAGIPQDVIIRAEQLLQNLEKDSKKPKKAEPLEKSSPLQDDQFFLFPVNNFEQDRQWVLKQLREINVDGLSPLEALQLIYNWKSRITN